MRYLLLILLFLSIATVCHAQEALKIAVFSDVHYLSDSLAKEGEALRTFENAVGRRTSDMHIVFDTVLMRIAHEKPDVLLIPGDLTNNGERASHFDFVKKLQPIAAQGTCIFIIPGNHDVNVPNTKKYIGAAPAPTENISAEDFAPLYADFGYAQAFWRDTASLSYATAINDSVWLLGIDSNRYREHTTGTISGGRILPETLDWALQIFREAKAKNIVVLAMMHHGLVEHLPYQSTFFSSYLIENWKQTAEILADVGLKIIFTGHFHANDISAFTSKNGNTLYDVETGSLIAYPFSYRMMHLKDRQLEINSYFVDRIAGVPNLEEKYRTLLEERSKKLARAKLNNLNMLLPEETATLLANLLAKMAVLHAAGDEKPDAEMQVMIKQFSESMHIDEENEDFQLDFPPEDNHVTIDLND